MCLLRFITVFALLITSAALTAGCSVLPASGPSANEIKDQETASNPLGGYVVVDLDERIASICASIPQASLRRIFANRSPAPDIRIGVGDTVSVTIWEAGAGGLFSASAVDRTLNAGSRTSTLPDQVVTRDGTIRVPYAGRLTVAGLRPAQVETEIVRALQGKAIEPQAVVTISRNYSNTVGVTGEVKNGALIPLNVRGDRVLDVIAGAGGIRIPAHETFVRLTRGNRTASIAYNAMLDNPEENIFVQPHDVITVVQEPQTFTAFGGTGRNASLPFEAVGVSLEEAIAKAGGLIDSRADPGGIFLLRFEPADLVSQLVPGQKLPSQGNLVPVVYRLNLRDTNAFFLARAFKVKNKDILYVANAPSDPIQKFLTLVGTLTAPAISGVGVYSAVK